MLQSKPFLTCITLLVFFLFGGVDPASGQNKWSLTENRDGIKIYTRPMANSKIKAIKAECILPATSSQLIAAILDIKNCDKWVYHSKKNVLIKQISPLDLIYYAEVDVPWPAENRDYVVHLKVEQHPQSKVVTVNSPCIPGYAEERPGIVRIRESVGQWTITPLGKNQVRAEYILEVDPLGTIPAWLINLFATKGPFETFQKLRLHLQQDVYRNAHYAAVVDME